VPIAYAQSCIHRKIRFSVINSTSVAAAAGDSVFRITSNSTVARQAPIGGSFQDKRKSDSNRSVQAFVTLQPVVTPGFVAIRSKDVNYVMGHSRWTSGSGAAAAP